MKSRLSDLCYDKHEPAKLSSSTSLLGEIAISDPDQRSSWKPKERVFESKRQL